MSIEIEKLLSSHKLPDDILQSSKYKQVRASIVEIGLIEPVTVVEADRAAGSFLVLDGHIRVVALKELGHSRVPCLQATDDEAYTYNNRINRLSAVQEHVMIRRALERGVSAERLAKALCINVKNIKAKSTLLDGICAEAIEVLKDRHFSYEVSLALKRMKPIRQLECVELMASANNFTITYARALLVATGEDLLVSARKKGPTSVSREQLARMEREMANLHGQYKLAEQSYGEDVLNLVLAKGYVSKLLGNSRVQRYLEVNHAELLEQFRDVVSTP
jgi:hypothetical protein